MQTWCSHANNDIINYENENFVFFQKESLNDSHFVNCLCIIEGIFLESIFITKSCCCKKKNLLLFPDKNIYGPFSSKAEKSFFIFIILTNNEFTMHPIYNYLKLLPQCLSVWKHIYDSFLILNIFQLCSKFSVIGKV